MDYTYLLNEIKEEEESLINTDRECCDNQDILFDITHVVCCNCGRSFNHEDIEDYKEVQSIRNPKFKLTTIMSPIYKYNRIARVHKWLGQDYYEKTANIGYQQIRYIGELWGCLEMVIIGACDLYKVIYIDKKISSRSNIKRALFIYCLNKASKVLTGRKLNVSRMIIKEDLTAGNYNDAILKIDDKDKLVINDDIIKFIKLAYDNYNVEIDYEEVLIKYNIILNTIKSLNRRINKKSIVTTTFYMILDKPKISSFCKKFNITKSTLIKYINLIKDIRHLIIQTINKLEMY